MTTQKALDKITYKGYKKNFIEVIQDYGFNEKVSALDIVELIQKAMILYAQQFIDAANDIIGPACDVLDENYDEEYEKWHKIQAINEVKN